MAIESIINGFSSDNHLFGYYLIEAYDLYNDEYYTKMSKEELEKELNEEYMPVMKEVVNNKDKFPPVGNTLKFKGNLRISWNFDIKYNKNIDLIFFMEENNYLKYALLHAKDFEKTMDTEQGFPRLLDEYEIPYNINYDFVKEILSKSELSEYQQKKFLDSRFGSVFVPMEIEFEWYVVYQEYGKTPLFLEYDEYLRAVSDEVFSFCYCLGIIKSHKILPKNTKINFKKNILELEDVYVYDEELQEEVRKELFTLPISVLFNPLPNTALAITKTNKLGDYVINVRDTPDSKDSKIIAQLFTQNFDRASMNEKMIEQGRIMCKEDNMDCSNNDISWALYYHDKMQKAYYKANKSKLINPQWEDKYLVFIQKILPNNWCKVLVLKVLDGLYKLEFWLYSSPNNRWYEFVYDHNANYKAYLDKFYNQISTITLADGYIHSSGLDYLAPFPRD